MKLLKGQKLPNGFMFIPIHYTHDKEGGKDTFQWQMEARASFPKPSDFDKEMEIDFGLHVGAPAYPRFSDAKHTAENLPYDDRRPLLLAFDFNANPMSLVVSQLYRQKKQLLTLDEFVYAGTIDAIVNDFRNKYNEHRADIIVYGDATKGTNAQTAASNWDIVRLAFRGYNVQPEFRLPFANPRIGNRLNAVNLLLAGNGEVQILIDTRCVELLRDLREVIMTPDGKQIFKEKDPDNPYYFRTHASDAWGYMIYREFPTVGEIVRELSKPRAPITPGKLLGEVDQGLKIERQLASMEKKRRKPMDRSKSR